MFARGTFATAIAAKKGKTASKPDVFFAKYNLTNAMAEDIVMLTKTFSKNVLQNL